jgi:hypothetical protein
MNQVNSKPINETQTTARKIVDFLVGLLSTLIMGNIGLLLFAQFDPQRMWILYFKWVWIFVLASLAMLLYTKKKVWISIGIVAAILLQSF